VIRGEKELKELIGKIFFLAVLCSHSLNYYKIENNPHIPEQGQKNFTAVIAEHLRVCIKKRQL